LWICTAGTSRSGRPYCKLGLTGSTDC
jgi:hypothetical protein